MPKALISSYSRYVANVEVNSNRGLFAGASSESQDAVWLDREIAESSTPVLESKPMSIVLDKEVAELAIRQLAAEIDYAKDELRELEEALLQELLKPPARRWLFPLMAIGLALSLYGSLTAVNSAEMGATGLMLLWSLSAFWLIYSGDKRMEKSRCAHKAEIEIWSNRIEELQQSLDRNRRIVEAAG
ncbi:MAG: hypothetical protein IT328_04180 [Caldilineaceae bacterium]|nr:hypothetical protein [Caldilineaceae bacterium]